jgi:hypothetical protein
LKEQNYNLFIVSKSVCSDARGACGRYSKLLDQLSLTEEDTQNFKKKVEQFGIFTDPELIMFSYES